MENKVWVLVHFYCGVTGNNDQQEMDVPLVYSDSHKASAKMEDMYEEFISSAEYNSVSVFDSELDGNVAEVYYTDGSYDVIYIYETEVH